MLCRGIVGQTQIQISNKAIQNHMYVTNQLTHTLSSDLPKNKCKILYWKPLHWGKRIHSNLCFVLSLAHTFTEKKKDTHIILDGPIEYRKAGWGGAVEWLWIPLSVSVKVRTDKVCQLGPKIGYWLCYACLTDVLHRYRNLRLATGHQNLIFWNYVVLQFF